MQQLVQTVLLLLGFAIVAVAATQYSKYLKRIKLPLITGLLLTGILAGPFFLGFIPKEAKENLYFINDISLAIIAFAASTELYLKELRSKLNTIKWMTFGQLAVTFILSTIIIFFMESYIPFMEGMDYREKLAVAILVATIFVARSPASAIAIINEVRARGPFTQTALGVTVLIDFLVIILFSICYSIAIALVHDRDFNLTFLLILAGELLAALILAYLLFILLRSILRARIHRYAKTLYVVLAGFLTYPLSTWVDEFSIHKIGQDFLIEPLLVCILGSFLITNYSKYRYEFIRIINDVSPFIYAAFFTLIGATMSIDVLIEVWEVAIILFLVRLITMVIGSFLGGALAGESKKFLLLDWMPFVTQAGVGLGLATAVSQGFPAWGSAFASLIIAVIVMNQLIGPPLFKYALGAMGEARLKAQTPEFDGARDALIFGLESQSVALARQLTEHGWQVKIATFRQDVNPEDYPNLTIEKFDEISPESLEQLNAHAAEAIITLLTDDENYKICEIAYEKVGTKDLVVRLNHRYNLQKFHKLGCLVVDPSTAIVSLMDHLVRSPQAASLILGFQAGQDTLDVEVTNPNMRGLPLRDLKLPPDIIVLSVKRGGQMIISHGYTRLRIGDIITMVGSRQSLEAMTLRLEK